MRQIKLFTALILLILLCVIPCASISAENEDLLTLAKSYEGNFYKYSTTGDWYIFSDSGVNLGEPIIDESCTGVEYYINSTDDYIIQYTKNKSGVTYAVWQDGTVVDMCNSL